MFPKPDHRSSVDLKCEAIGKPDHPSLVDLKCEAIGKLTIEVQLTGFIRSLTVNFGSEVTFQQRLLFRRVFWLREVFEPETVDNNSQQTVSG